MGDVTAMEKKQATCQAGRIEQFLGDQLGDAEQTEFEDHLDGCDVCRLELERRAADPAVWREVRELLSSVDVADQACGASPLTPPIPAADSDVLASGEGDVAQVDTVLERLAPTDDPRMLGRFGGYEISGVIGCGGMGVVLKGFDAALSRYVAIKVLAPHLAASGSSRRRFAREARAAAAVVHENVVAIHGVAEASNLPYFVMPYVRGTSLQKRLNQRGPLGVNEVLRVAVQTAAGLAAAHAQGLVHRDIKPANMTSTESRHTSIFCRRSPPWPALNRLRNNCWAVFFTHSSSPYGSPRVTLRRIVSSSDSV